MTSLPSAVERPARPRRRVWGRLLQPKTLALTTVAVVVVYLGLVPLVYLLWGAFFDETGFTLEGFQRAYGDPRLGLGELVGNTLLFGAGATVFSVVIGTGLAYATERTDVPFRPLIFAMSLVPEIVPGVLYTIAWIFLGSPRIGLLNEWLGPVFGGAPVNVFSLPGMMLVQGLDGVPLVYLLMFAAFRSADPALEEAAIMSGAKLTRVIARVTVPSLMPAISAAVLITLIRNVESFETPALLGMPGGVWVFTSRIWWALGALPPDYGQAAAYAISLLVLSAVGVFFYSRLSKRGRAFQTVTGKGFRPGRIRLRRWRWPIGGAILLYFAVAVALPALVMIYLSFQPFYSVPSLGQIADSTTENYSYVFGQEMMLRAFRNSLLLGVGAATAVMFLAALTSWIVVRTRLRGRWLLDTVSFLPLVIPGLVLGVALIFLYLRFPVAIYGTLWIMLIAYCTRYMPYAMRYVSTSMFQIGSELEESAQVSGATWWYTFRRVTLPLLMPGLVAGWVFIVMISVRELSTSILLYSPGQEVLAVLLWSLYDGGQLGAVSALGIVMIGVLVVLMLVARKVGGRFGVPGSG